MIFKLIINSGKTKCMVFSNARHVTNHVIATLAGHTIEQVKVYKYLGVWVHDKLADVYMQASTTTLRALDSVYHATLRFITNQKRLTHHCDLYSSVGW